MDKKLLAVVFLFIALSTQEIGAVTRTCKSRSREFAGRCLRINQRNCNIVCIHEGFEYGVCTKQARCYCAKACGGSPPDQDAPPEMEVADQFLLGEPQASLN